MKENLVKREDRWDLYDVDGHKIASTLKGCSNELSIKNCQAIELGYDLDEIKRKVFDGFDGQPNSFTIAAVERTIQIMLELMGDKKYSEEDVKLAIEYGIQSVLQAIPGVTSTQSILDAYKQELQQTEWDVEIEMENAVEIFRDGTINELNIPKLDKDGCLILKKI